MSSSAAERADGTDRLALAGTAAALLFCILWASAYVPSKIGSTFVPPYWFLAVRFAIAGAIMTVLAFALRRPFPATARAWAGCAVLGIFTNAGYLGLTYTALSHGLASGVGAIVASTNPLILAVVGPWLLRERLTRLKAAGMLLGFGGVLAIVLARGGGAAAAPGDVLLAVAGVCASVISTILFKRAGGESDLFALNSIGLCASALVMLPLALVFEGALPIAGFAFPEVQAAMAYLVLIVSIGVSLLWFWLLTHGEASRVSAYYFLTPAFGLAFGALLLHEQFHPSDLIGLVAIAAGIILVQRSTIG